MLEFIGLASSYCDRISRRNLLRIGALGVPGLSLAELLRQRASAASAAAARKSASVIFVEMAGGPSHFETYDPKPAAPKEYRGPLASIPTRIPGLRFSELMAAQAKIADRLAILRAIHHESSAHETSSHLAQTGYYLRDRQNRENEMPCAGAIVARLCGANRSGVPAYVSMPQVMRCGDAAYLGKAYNPFVAAGDPSKPNFKINNLELVKSLSMNRLDNRRALLASLDRSRRVLDNRGLTDAIDKFSLQAFDMVTGDRARSAFDLNAEEPKVRDRYGRTQLGQNFLLARRLVEAGVTFISIRAAGWDHHVDIAKQMHLRGPVFDRSLAALIEEIYERGLDRDVLIVAMGEFGRTPRVNRKAGRDHWGALMSVAVSGGGLKVGQAVGSSNRKGEVPVDKPYRPENVLAMIYRHVGIDPIRTFADLTGRPRYILEERRLIKELI